MNSAKIRITKAEHDVQWFYGMIGREFPVVNRQSGVYCVEYYVIDDSVDDKFVIRYITCGNCEEVHQPEESKIITLQNHIEQLTKENEGFRTKKEHQFQSVYQDLVVELGVKDGGSVIEAVNQLQKQVEQLQLDKLRMDYLAGMIVNVRDNLPHGSRNVFWSQVISDDDDPTMTNIRELIDLELAKGKK